jgi:hypothetical protein
MSVRPCGPLSSPFAIEEKRGLNCEFLSSKHAPLPKPCRKADNRETDVPYSGSDMRCSVGNLAHSVDRIVCSADKPEHN